MMIDVIVWLGTIVLPETSEDVRKIAEIRRFLCYNRPVKPGPIRHQSGIVGVHKLIGSGQIEAVKIGRSTFIPYRCLKRLIGN